MPPPTDELLAGLRRGDSEAYGQLVALMEGPLYRYFLAAHGDARLAGEQSTDCFSEVFRVLPKMKGDAEQLRPFVFGVARNVLRRSWRGGRQNSTALDSADEPASATPTPDRSAEAREELARLLAAIAKLDPATREVFVLRFVEQLPLAEVAAAVGEPLGTVKSRIHRGRLKLEPLLLTAPTGAKKT